MLQYREAAKCYISATFGNVRSISQRELRNDSGRIMREVENGTTFTVTSRGRPIATLTPIGPGPADGLLLREPSTELVFPARVRIDASTDDVLAELRGER